MDNSNISEEEMISKIQANKPRLKLSSVKSYISKLKNINKQLGNENLLDLSPLTDKSIIDEFIKDKSFNTQKTYYGTVVSLLKSLQDDDEFDKVIREYQKDMQKYMKEAQAKEEEQKKTEKQDKNWATLEELRGVIDDIKNNVDSKGLFSKEELSKKEFHEIQKYIVGSLYLADIHNNPPLRLDYAPMRIMHIEEYKADPPKENALVIVNKNKKFFELVDYKTKETYGIKNYVVGETLNKILNKWLKVNKSKYLLLNNNDKPMQGVDLSKLIMRIFEPLNKKIGVSLLRHIVISQLYPADLKARMRTAELMGHSVAQQFLYAKK